MTGQDLGDALGRGIVLLVVIAFGLGVIVTIFVPMLAAWLKPLLRHILLPLLT